VIAIADRAYEIFQKMVNGFHCIGLKKEIANGPKPGTRTSASAWFPFFFCASPKSFLFDFMVQEQDGSVFLFGLHEGGLSICLIERNLARCGSGLKNQTGSPNVHAVKQKEDMFIKENIGHDSSKNNLPRRYAYVPIETANLLTIGKVMYNQTIGGCFLLLIHDSIFSYR
jgi:hypothetical protein